MRGKLSKKLKSSILIATLIISLESVCVIPGNAAESTSKSENGYVVDEYERLATSLSNKTVGAVRFNDPRNSNIMTDIKDQETTDLCWLYSTTGMADTYVYKKYGSKFSTSAAHGGVAMSNAISQKNIGYYNNTPSSAGNNAKALQYMTNWNSPIFYNNFITWNSMIAESDYPISTLLHNSNNLITDEFKNSKSLYHVTSSVYLNYHDTDSIKSAIKEYGAVTSGIRKNTNFGKDSNGELNIYNYTAGLNLSPNHEIMIVGWNDKYSKDNFTTNPKPTVNGAWLIKDSDLDCGYYWMSYDDSYLKSSENNIMAITGIEKSSDREHMLSYDYFIPAYKSKYSFKDDLYLCNVFNVNDYVDEYNEINKVMFYLRASGCNYEVKIIDVTNDILPTDLDDIGALAEGSFSGEGYITENLSTPYNIESGGKYAIIIKLSPKSSSSRIYIPYEGTFKWTKNSKEILPEINENESFFGTLDSLNNIAWNDCFSNDEYCDGNKGNLIIRPVLSKAKNVSDDIVLNPDTIIDTSKDEIVKIKSDSELFSVHTSNNRILRQNVDYVRNKDGIIIKSSYLNSLNGTYTKLVLEFNNDITKNIVVNPKANITSVTLSGNPIVGDEVSAVVSGIPEKESYDVNYQWQSSVNGTSWVDISGAVTADYTINENDFRRYLRVKVTATRNGNVMYPTTKYSNSTKFRTVILGDVDLNGIVDVLDSTLLREYIAKIKTLTDEQVLAGDVDRDSDIDIIDATLIQKIALNIKWH